MDIDFYLPKPPYRTIGRYYLQAGNDLISIETLLSLDNVIGWTPVNDQDHINPQYRDPHEKIPIRIEEISYSDIIKMLAQAISFKTKQIPTDDIIKRHYSNLVQKVFEDFQRNRTVAIH